MLKEIILYLESVRESYPGGVPRRLLTLKKESPAPAPQKYRVRISGSRDAELAFAITTTGKEAGPFEGEVGQLLERVIAKGLNQPVDSVCILEASAEDGPAGQPLRDLLEEEIHNGKFRVVVALGEAGDAIPAASGQKSRQIEKLSNGKFVLRAHSLLEMVQDPAKKKSFWTGLKNIMSELGWRSHE